MSFGSYNGVNERETVYKGTNKDYLPEAKPRSIDHFSSKAKPSKGKSHCPRAQPRHLLARIHCRALINPSYNFLYIIRRVINRFLLGAKNHLHTQHVINISNPIKS